MRRVLGALFAAMLICPAGAAPQKEERPNLVPAFATAFANKDAEALAMLYFENAVLLPPNEPEVIGRAQIRDWYAKAFSSGISDFKTESRTGLHEGPVGYERGAYSVRVVGAAGTGQARTDTRKYLWSLRKSATGWLIDAHMFNSDH